MISRTRVICFSLVLAVTASALPVAGSQSNKVPSVVGRSCFDGLFG